MGKQKKEKGKMHTSWFPKGLGKERSWRLRIKAAFVEHLITSRAKQLTCITLLHPHYKVRISCPHLTAGETAAQRG